MKSISVIIGAAVFILSVPWSIGSYAQIPEEMPLWPHGIPGNPVKYKEEKIKVNDFRQSSLSQSNRVFSCVSEPSYYIIKSEKSNANGAAMVICPGGGFRDVWIDREGRDLGLWLAQKGVTCLILKYRTFNPGEEGFKLDWNAFAPHVYADARQAIFILRSRGKELGIDEHKTGIGGFSAGGSLAMMATLISSLY